MQPSERLSKLFNIFSGQPVGVSETIVKNISKGEESETYAASIDADDVCLKALGAILASEGLDLNVMLVTPDASDNDLFMENSVKAYIQKDEKSIWRIKEFRMG